MTAADERAALYRAIIDAPKDDAVRLVYADWLEEHGDPYAQVIRRLMVEPDRSEAYDAGVVLFGYRLQFSIPSGMTLIFRRGFVAEVRAPLDVLLGAGAAVVKAHPVEKMVATDREPGRSGDFWFWHDDRRGPSVIVDGCSYLPAAVFDEMVRQGYSFDYVRGESNFRSQEAAIGAFSKALLTVLNDLHQEEADGEEEA